MKKLQSIAKIKWLVLGAVLLALPVLAVTKLTYAQRFAANVESGSVVDSSVYGAAKTVTINGTINGDVYCVGQDVTVDATVHGDVLCAGNSVTVNGHVDGSVRAAARTVYINATVGQSVSVAGNLVTLDKNTTVGRDLSVAGGTATINGKVGRDAGLRVAEVKLDGAIGRDLTATATTTTLSKTASVGRNMTYTSDTDADIAKGAHIGGSQQHKPITHPQNGHHWFVVSLKSFLYILAAFMLAALLLTLFFPQLMNAAATTAQNGMTKTLLIGLASFIGLPMLMTILFLTFVGFAAAILVFFVWLILLMLSGPVAAFYVGRMVLFKSHNAIWIALVGTVIVAVLEFLPVAGFLVMLIVYCIGAGASCAPSNNTCHNRIIN
jgi:cytoskeletal protein CcmA (bactofilin family)